MSTHNGHATYCITERRIISFQLTKEYEALWGPIESISPESFAHPVDAIVLCECTDVVRQTMTGKVIKREEPYTELCGYCFNVDDCPNFVNDDENFRGLRRVGSTQGDTPPIVPPEGS